MDEYEKLEVEVQQNYSLYLDRFKNLSYLQNQLEELNKVEQEQIQDLQRMKKHYGDNDEEDPMFSDIVEVNFG